jgi:hypothetical protein
MSVVPFVMTCNISVPVTVVFTKVNVNVVPLSVVTRAVLPYRDDVTLKYAVDVCMRDPLDNRGWMTQEMVEADSKGSN